MIVSIIGISTAMLTRIEMRNANNARFLIESSALAHAAVEQCANTIITIDPNWRSNFLHDTWQPENIVGQGAFRWKIVADSGNLQVPNSGDVTIVGRGTSNGVTQFRSVRVSEVKEMGPIELRSYTNTSSTSQDEVLPDKSWGQYFKPNLPPEATGWKVTSVEVYSAKRRGNRLVDIQLYEPLPSNLPSSTLVDSMTMNSDSIGSSFAWNEFAFSGDYALNPTDGLCLTLTTFESNGPIEIEYVSGGVSEAESALLTGDPTWNSSETDKSLRYRIHGTYTIEDELELIGGSWSVGNQ